MTITWEQVLAFLCEDQTMAITSLLFLAFFAAVALINYALPRVLRPYFLLAASYGFFCYDPVNRPLVWVIAAATVLPCYWLYAEVALRMAEKNTPNHPYQAWLSAYADEGFIEDTRQAIERVERALEAAGEATREEATRNFMYAAYWEREFFGQALRAS